LGKARWPVTGGREARQSAAIGARLEHWLPFSGHAVARQCITFGMSVASSMMPKLSS
jgi:hypothetical protein